MKDAFRNRKHNIKYEIEKIFFFFFTLIPNERLTVWAIVTFIIIIIIIIICFLFVFFFFFQKSGFDISCKCLQLGKIKKININLLSAE